MVTFLYILHTLINVKYTFLKVVSIFIWNTPQDLKKLVNKIWEYDWEKLQVSVLTMNVNSLNTLKGIAWKHDLHMFKINIFLTFNPFIYYLSYFSLPVCLCLCVCIVIYFPHHIKCSGIWSNNIIFPDLSI